MTERRGRTKERISKEGEERTRGNAQVESSEPRYKFALFWPLCFSSRKSE